MARQTNYPRMRLNKDLKRELKLCRLSLTRKRKEKVFFEVAATEFECHFYSALWDSENILNKDQIYTAKKRLKQLRAMADKKGF